MSVVVNFPTRDRVAVLTVPTEGEWHVTVYEVGLGTVIKHRVYFNPWEACGLLVVLGRGGYGPHRIIFDSSAERWRWVAERWDAGHGGAR